jgi:hypothetical protein
MEMSSINESTLPFHPTVTMKLISSTASQDISFYHQQEVNISYDDLRRSMPERFDLSMLDTIFTSWNTSWQSVANKSEYSLENQRAEILVELEHDHHVYRSDIKVSHFYRDKKRERMLTIKLPNNGFMFPCPYELKVFESADFCHRPSTHVKLAAAHLAQFPQMIHFAKAYLSSASVSCKMFYNVLNGAFDIKIYNMRGGTDSVCFSFHRCDTLDHEFDEDYWLDA